MSSLLRNARTVLSHPGMLSHYVRWCSRPMGVRPAVRLPNGAGRIYGFRSFSEYWWGRQMIPDPAEVAFYRQFTGGEGVILDIGANLGGHALTLAALHARHQVHAFEPSPDTFERLQQNIALNGALNVRAHRIALADGKGTMSFDADPRSPGTNRLLCGESSASCSDVVNVEVRTVDSVLDEIGNPKVAMMKLDVEGFEPAVLRGSERALKRGDVVAGLMELCPGNLDRVGSSVEELLHVVHRCGYAMFFLGANGTPGRQVGPDTAREVALCNVALLKPR